MSSRAFSSEVDACSRQENATRLRSRTLSDSAESESVLADAQRLIASHNNARRGVALECPNAGGRKPDPPDSNLDQLEAHRSRSLQPRWRKELDVYWSPRKQAAGKRVQERPLPALTSRNTLTGQYKAVFSPRC